jgi:hypothetical protein
MTQVIYKDLVVSKLAPGEWEVPTPLIGEFETTYPTPTQAENDSLTSDTPALVMQKRWDLSPVDQSSFDPTEPPGRPDIPAPPAPTAAPVLTGIPMVGEVLTTTNGVWTGNPTPTFTRQWRRGTTNIGGGGLTHTCAVADIGFMMSCNVTAANSQGNVTASSNDLGPVLDVPPLDQGEGEAVQPSRRRRTT